MANHTKRPVKRPNTWVKQLDTAYRKGYAADKDAVNPYFAGGSVNRQRASAWQRGHARAAAGEPLSDIGQVA